MAAKLLSFCMYTQSVLIFLLQNQMTSQTTNLAMVQRKRDIFGNIMFKQRDLKVKGLF